MIFINRKIKELREQKFKTSNLFKKEIFIQSYLEDLTKFIKYLAFNFFKKEYS